MTELQVMALYFVMRALILLGLIAAATYLAVNDKQGWGWILFIAVLVASSSVKYTKD
jgi:hypothetical protein